MKSETLSEILKKIKSVKIAVVGDFCLDAYWFVDESKSEISIETGQATRPVSIQKYSPGGAGNVTNNLAALGIKDIRAFGVIGKDPFGPEMVKVMKNAGINTNNLLIQDENWATHVYIKPYVGDKEQSRIDFGNHNVLSEDTADRLITRLEKAVKEVDIIIINQQVLSGIHTPYFRKKLVEAVSHFPDRIFIADSRNYNDLYTGTYRKMNDTEALLQCGVKKGPDETIPYSETLNAAKTLFDRYEKPLFITRGSRGSLVVNEKGITQIPGLMIISKVDTVGAGDSFLAGAAATLAADYKMDTAAEIGSYVAGVTVQKLFQTGTATPDEVMAIGNDPDYIYEPELAEDIRQANLLKDSEFEIINSWPKNLNIRHVIFDHDGTISTLREGWEKIMAPMMIKAILGNQFLNAEKSLYTKVESRVTELIDKTTGIQTLMQMKLLTDVIREFGCVPEDQILNEYGYKEIYNKEILQLVKEREGKLMRSELLVEDFTMKNIVPFLTRLHAAGIKLYLASGTDAEDVREEAAALGYAHLFEDRIFGAVGDLNKEAKKIVLENILDLIGESARGEIATFGDGPVEIRETRKRGGITIGVASDEKKRFGLNAVKRTRLIKAGADIIIPDFTQSEKLLKLLNII
ncbi:MAG: carbohydrate kinase [Bacteroidales bacterium]|nr:carbohydrate kinase [Bacteroidales bacterium]